MQIRRLLVAALLRLDLLLLQAVESERSSSMLHLLIPLGGCKDSSGNFLIGLGLWRASKRLVQTIVV